MGRLSSRIICGIEEISRLFFKVTGDFLRSPTYLYRAYLKSTDVGQLLLVEINRCHDNIPLPLICPVQ